jgi:hypothetical protein
MTNEEILEIVEQVPTYYDLYTYITQHTNSRAEFYQNMRQARELFLTKATINVPLPTILL